MRYLSENWEEVQVLPHLRSWEDAVKGQAVRVDRNTIPPKQFVRDEDLLYTWKRLIYDPYSGRVYLDDRQTKPTIDEVLLFGSPMERRGPTERYDPFETAVVERLNRIDEVFEKLVKPLNSEAPWVYVFRVGDAWYSDYTTYRAGGEAQAFTTAQEAADALKERTRRFYKDPDEIKRKEEEKRLEAERVAEETRRQLAKAAALAERRRAEDEEITALEAQLADIERTRYLNELRAKVARAKENGDV